jgi:hypothetical protein
MHCSTFVSRCTEKYSEVSQSDADNEEIKTANQPYLDAGAFWIDNEIALSTNSEQLITIKDS